MFQPSCNPKCSLRMLSALAFVLLLVHEAQGQLDVTTFYYGTYRGSYTKYQNAGTVYKFLGIPYAKPPVGELRFQKPEKVKAVPNKNLGKPQKNPYMAMDYKPACPQYSEQPFPWYDLEPGKSEDCLYLNIWAPLAAINSKQEGFQVPVKGERIKRPVKVYIHGGGWFETGSIRQLYYDGFGEARDTIDGDGNSLQDGIIVVTIQYRLGALGFLTSGTDDAPGNVGLFDIKTGLDWVTQSIGSWGGDYNQITVVGQDGGAIAVSLMATVPGIGPGTYKVVVNAGSLLTLKAFPGVDEKGDAFQNNLRLTDVLAEAVGCEGSVKEDPAGVIGCLRGVNATRLMKVMSSLGKKGPPNVFLPQTGGTDGFFYYGDPFLAFAKYPFTARMDVLGSFTRDEGSHLLTTAFPKVFGDFGENDTALSASCAKLVARSFLRKFPPSVADQLLGDLDKKATIENRNKVVQAFGDAYFTCPVVFYVETIRTTKSDEQSANRTFLLEKNVIPPYNPWAEWMGSVHFDNVQTDFLHPYGYILIKDDSESGRQQYNYNESQTAQAKAYNGLLMNFMRAQDLPIDQFTLDNPAYGVLDLDGTISSDGNTNYHGKNCDILRPYFQYKDPEE